MQLVVCSGCERECHTHLTVCPDCGTPVGYIDGTSIDHQQTREAGAESSDEPSKPASNDVWLLRLVIAIAFSLPVSLLVILSTTTFMTSVALLGGASDEAATPPDSVFWAVWLIGWLGAAFYAYRAEVVRKVVRRTAVIYAWGAFTLPLFFIISMLISCGGPAWLLFCALLGLPVLLAVLGFGLGTGAMGATLAHFLGKES